jgi:hypothetical protein
MVPVFNKRQVLLDFLLDKSQGSLKLFLAAELEACFIEFGMAVLKGNGPYELSNEVDLGRRRFSGGHFVTFPCELCRFATKTSADILMTFSANGLFPRRIMAVAVAAGAIALVSGLGIGRLLTRLLAGRVGTKLAVAESAI